ncbi:hypothetical protein [Streptomyces sp. NPDC058308]|uniref:hypothetical protein n=1 Tax=Streptomyces sp. NPDC058308 TaxID=3346440 RepID=UPI0036E2515D
MTDRPTAGGAGPQTWTLQTTDEGELAVLTGTGGLGVLHTLSRTAQAPSAQPGE